MKFATKRSFQPRALISAVISAQLTAAPVLAQSTEGAAGAAGGSSGAAGAGGAGTREVLQEQVVLREPVVPQVRALHLVLQPQVLQARSRVQYRQWALRSQEPEWWSWRGCSRSGDC